MYLYILIHIIPDLTMSMFIPQINGDLKPRGRSGHVAVFYKGHFLVHGGYTTESSDKYMSVKEIWSFNIETSQWTRLTTTG